MFSKKMQKKFSALCNGKNEVRRKKKTQEKGVPKPHS